MPRSQLAQERVRKPSAARSRRLRVGLFIDLLAAHGRGIFKSIADYAQLADWTLVHRYPWSVSDFDVAVYGPSHISALKDIDALIASCHDPAAERIVRSLGVPTVNISSVRPDPIVPSVFTDNQAIGRLAASHLLERGLQNFAFFQAFPAHWFDIRRQSFVEAIRSAGFETSVLSLPSTTTGDARKEAITRWLVSLPLPVGLAVLHDVTALEILNLCRDLNLAVPEQFAVLSCDDDELIQRLSDPPLSSIRPDYERHGHLAANMLDDLLHGRPVGASPLLVPPLAVSTRLSTDVLAIDEPDVRMALQYIREHAAEPLTVKDVLNALPLSRRPLEKRFRKTLNRTILDEIHRTKVERSKQLLVNSKLSISQVAQACGFPSAARFSIVFRSVTGQTPTRYRQRL